MERRVLEIGSGREGVLHSPRGRGPRSTSRRLPRIAALGTIVLLAAATSANGAVPANRAAAGPTLGAAQGSLEAEALRRIDRWEEGGRSEAERAALAGWLEELERAGAEEAPKERADRGYAIARIALALLERPAGETVARDRAERERLWEAADRGARLADDPETIAHVRWRRALELRWLGRTDAARELLWQAAHEQGAEGMAPWLWIDLAECDRALGRLDLAHDELERADAALAESRDEGSGAFARAALDGARAELWLALGVPERAAVLVRREHERAAELGDPALFSAALLHEANLRLALEDHRGLLEWLPPWLEAGREWLDRRTRAMLLLRSALARLELAREESEHRPRAREQLEALLDEPALPPAERERARTALAQLHALDGRWDTVRALLSEGALDEEPSLARLAILARLALAQGEGQLQLVERRDALAAAVRRIQVSLASAPIPPTGAGFLRYADRRSALGAWIALERELAGPEAALGVLVEAGSLGSLTRRIGPPPRAEIEPRDLLPADRGEVVAFLPAPEETHRFRITADGIEHRTLPPAWRIERARLTFDRARARWLAAMRGAGRGPEARELDAVWAEAHEAGGRLASLLLAGLADRGPLVLVGGDLLMLSAVAALPGPDGLPLGVARALSEVPTLSLGSALARRGPEGTESRQLVAIVGPRQPGAAGEVSALPFRTEAWIGDGGWSARRVVSMPIDPLGTLRDVLGGGESLALWLAHGDYRPDREWPTRLLVGPGEAGWLDRSILESLPTPPLVLLAVCGGSLAPRRRGDEAPASLASGALIAGAQCVLASPEPLPLEAVRRLTRRFLGALGSGSDVAEALRRAREASWRAGDLTTFRTTASVAVIGLGKYAPVSTPPLAGARHAEGKGERTEIRWWVAVGALVLLAGTRAVARISGAGRRV